MAIRILLISLLAMGSSLAATVSNSLPDYDGPYATSGFPIDLGIIGNFAYALPGGAVITAATLSGTYGTSMYSTSTASFEAVVDGAQVEVCAPFAVNCWPDASSFRPFSLALPASAFSRLLDGTASLGVIQTTEYVVRFGSPTLTIEYTDAPEPVTLGMAALAGVVLLTARRCRTAGVQAPGDTSKK